MEECTEEIEVCIIQSTPIKFKTSCLQDINLISCRYCSLVLGNLETVRSALNTHDCLKKYKTFKIDIINQEIYGVEALTIVTQCIKNNIESKISQAGDKWSHEAISCLINSYKLHNSKLLSPQYNKKKVWDLISKEMEKDGHIKSGSKYDEKWRNLKKTYEKVLKNNKETGANRKNWAYFDELHDVFLRNPSVNPVITISSTGQITRQKVLSETLSPTIIESEETVTSDSEGVSTAPIKKRKLDVVEENQERRHRERMEQKERMFEWLKNFLESKSSTD